MSDYLEIRNALSIPAGHDPASVSRRRFLAWIAAGGATIAAAPLLSSQFARAAEFVGAAPIGANEGILVLIQLGGGNDGLNMVAPVDDGRYRDLRGSIALDPGASHRIGQGLALHPALGGLKQRYDSGQVAVLSGVGDVDADMSHFVAMERWMRGAGSGNLGFSGWLGRYLDTVDGAADLAGVAVSGHGVPLTMVGRNRVGVGLSGGPPSWLVSDKEAEIRSVRPKWKFKDLAELKEQFPESQILDVGKEVGVVKKAQLKVLQGHLATRNQCAHPTVYLPSLNVGIGYVDELIAFTKLYISP